MRTFERTETAAPLRLLLERRGGVTGQAGTVAVRDPGSGDYLDFADNTFKAAGWTTRQQALTEVDATNSPGVYEHVLNLSLITLPDFIEAEYEVSSGPVQGVDSESIAIVNHNKDVAIQSDILSDATPFPGANIDVAISTRSDHNPAAVYAEFTAGANEDAFKADVSPLATSVEIAALNDLSQADVQAALTAQGYTPARATNLDNLDVAVSTRSDHTPADVDTLITANHGTGPYTFTQADVQTALTNQGYTVARAANLDNMDVAVSTRSDHNPNDVDIQLTTNHGAGDWNQAAAQAALTAEGYTPARAANLDNLDATVSSRSNHTPADVDTQLSGTHGAGAWDATLAGDWTTAERENIRQALGVDGTKTPGGTPGDLQEVLTDTAAVQPLVSANLDVAVSSRSNHSPLDVDTQLSGAHGAGNWEDAATLAAIAGQNDLSQADVQSAMTAQGYTAPRAPNLDNLDVAVSTRAVPGDAMDVNPTGVASVADGVWDEADNHFAPNTMGGLLWAGAAQGLTFALDDNFVFAGPPGQPTAFRRRVFATLAARTAATPGAADGADGEIMRFTGVAAYTGTTSADVLVSMSLDRVA